MWCHHLIGKRFLLISNNISLKYLFDQQNLNISKARWLAFLREYDFEIKHIKGKENKVADSLRKNAIIFFIAAIRSYKTKLDGKLKEWITMGKEYQNLKEKVTKNESKNVKTDYSLNEKSLML